jgi:MSHA biogenesis protein MshJ
MKDPDAPTRARLADVRARIAAADGQIAQFGGVLVAPDRVAELLQSLLSRHGGLSLVSLRTLPPSPLIAPPTPDKDAKPAEKSAEKPAVAMPSPGNIYRHGIEIKVSGTYHGLLGYVAELERSPQKLLWGSMALKVTSHPYSELTLVVYTLSLDSTWLIV